MYVRVTIIRLEQLCEVSTYKDTLVFTQCFLVQNVAIFETTEYVIHNACVNGVLQVKKINTLF